MTKKIAPKPTAGKGEPAPAISQAALREALVTFKGALDEAHVEISRLQSHLTREEAFYECLHQEVQEAETCLEGVVELLRQEYEGQPTHHEEARQILGLVLENLTFKRERFTENRKSLKAVAE